MGLQHKRQVAPVSSDNSWLPFVDTGLQEEERPAQYPSTLNPAQKLQIPIFESEVWICVYVGITKFIPRFSDKNTSTQCAD